LGAFHTLAGQMRLVGCARSSHAAGCGRLAAAEMKRAHRLNGEPFEFLFFERAVRSRTARRTPCGIRGRKSRRSRYCEFCPRQGIRWPLLRTACHRTMGMSADEQQGNRRGPDRRMKASLTVLLSLPLLPTGKLYRRFMATSRPTFSKRCPFRRKYKSSPCAGGRARRASGSGRQGAVQQECTCGKRITCEVQRQPQISREEGEGMQSAFRTNPRGAVRPLRTR